MGAARALAPGSADLRMKQTWGSFHRHASAIYGLTDQLLPPKLWQRRRGKGLNSYALIRPGIAVLVLMLASCSPSEFHGASPSPSSRPATYESLRTRPVALPTVASVGFCPVSRPASGSKVPKGSFVPNGFGEGPVYLTGQGIGGIRTRRFG